MPPREHAKLAFRQIRGVAAPFSPPINKKNDRMHTLQQDALPI